MDTVAFISSELGDDLIVSFAIEGHRDPADIRSLTLIRTPKYEALLPQDDRGVSASLEGHELRSTDYVVEVTYSEGDRVVKIKTQTTTYVLVY